MTEEIESHVLERYQVLGKLGKGAYGVVWKARDKITKAQVALKKVFDAFQNSTDAQRTYREAMYLQHLKGHDNIIGLQSILRAHNNKDLYLVFDLMETDLHAVIRAGILKPVHKQFIMYQLFKALKYMHSANLVHRDLKPANMLLNSDCLMKLADFGLARSLTSTESSDPPIVSDYIATRWYRAPEILLGSTSYGLSVDLWSAGCILAEILLEKVLFAGKSSLNQIDLIVELLGKPSTQDLACMKVSYANELMPSLKGKKTKSFSNIFSSCPPEALGLLRQLLVYDPAKRLTVTEVLFHPFFSKFHNESDEIICNRPLMIPIDDAEKLSLKVYRDAIYNDISFHLKKQKYHINSKEVDKKLIKPKTTKQLTATPNTLEKRHDLPETTQKAKFSRANHNSLNENKKNDKSISSTLLRKKNKSEDYHSKNFGNKILEYTSKYNQKVEISRSNLHADNKVSLSNASSAKKLLIKGFFHKKNDISYSMSLFKKTTINPNLKTIGES